MNEKYNIIAMIPARIGSTRLPMKNLALVDGMPLIAYAIAAAQSSCVFDRIIVNSDSDVFQEIAKEYKVEHYSRPKYLGSSTTKADDVVLDFIEKYPCDIVAWVNPTSPLQPGEEVKNVVEYFLDNNLDGLITVADEKVHCIYEGKPVNFYEGDKFAQTQSLKPVQSFVYSVMMWRTDPFKKSMKEHGHAFFVGKMGYYPVSKLTKIIIKHEEDLIIADSIMRSLRAHEMIIEYHELAKKVLS